MNPDDPTYREYGSIVNVMTVIEQLKSCLTKPLEMQTKTRKAILRNTRGPNPLYDPDALPERTMQFMREFKDFESEENKRKGKPEEFDIHEEQYEIRKILETKDIGRSNLVNRMQKVEQTFLQNTDAEGAFLTNKNKPELATDNIDD